MKTVLVTGSEGFIGKNLCVRLARLDGINLLRFDVGTPSDSLGSMVDQSDAIVHLAGVNRPSDESEFETVNVGLTQRIVTILKRKSRETLLVFASSTQAGLENPYGASKKRAEDVLKSHAEGDRAVIRCIRLPGAFGKWCKPNYNSVVATFCYKIARGQDISIVDPLKRIDLVYVDDIVRTVVDLISTSRLNRGFRFEHVSPIYNSTIGDLASLIRDFRDSRQTLCVSNQTDPFIRALYATYLSYVPDDEFAYSLPTKRDSRGVLAELLKSPQFGQIFVSRTLPGGKRGNHYHDTKVEKFCVIEGQALIRFRRIGESTILEYRVSGEEFKVVDIPPGVTHSLENAGSTELVVLFWSNEIFNPEYPDTFSCEV